MSELIRVSLGVRCHGGWTAYEGLLGGPGPLASVIFCHMESSLVQKVGVDLDKGTFITSAPYTDEIMVRDIVTKMNAERRRLVFSEMVESDG